MGFIDKLWDETLAGPAPEMGLGKLRKHNRSPNRPSVNVASRYNEHHISDDQTVTVSRSITVLRSKNLTVEPGSGSSTPTSSGPSSPSSPGATRDPDVKQFSMKKPTFDSMGHGATSPTVYDWILIGALDS